MVAVSPVNLESKLQLDRITPSDKWDVTAGLQYRSRGAPDTQSEIIIIHLLGLAPAGYLAASDNGA
jgi:hypothetical protein